MNKLSEHGVAFRLQVQQCRLLLGFGGEVVQPQRVQKMGDVAFARAQYGHGNHRAQRFLQLFGGGHGVTVIVERLQRVTVLLAVAVNIQLRQCLNRMFRLFEMQVFLAVELVADAVGVGAAQPGQQQRFARFGLELGNQLRGLQAVVAVLSGVNHQHRIGFFIVQAAFDQRLEDGRRCVDRHVQRVVAFRFIRQQLAQLAQVACTAAAQNQRRVVQHAAA